jgi:hypothetical protein
VFFQSSNRPYRICVYVMDMSNYRSARRGLLVALAVVTLSWRTTALLFPSAVTDVDDAFRVALAVLGLLFLGCGLYVTLRVSNESAKAFLLYCFGSAIHWGGSVGVPANAEVLLLSVYIALSAVADGALLHLALVFPKPLVSSATPKAASYIPAALGIFLIPVSVAVSAGAFQTLAAATLMLASFLSIGAGVILIGQYIRHEPAQRRRFKLGIVVFCGLTSAALAVVGSSGLIAGQPNAWNLLFGVLPITLTLALTTNASRAGQPLCRGPDRAKTVKTDHSPRRPHG